MGSFLERWVFVKSDPSIVFKLKSGSFWIRSAVIFFVLTFSMILIVIKLKRESNSNGIITLNIRFIIGNSFPGLGRRHDFKTYVICELIQVERQEHDTGYP